MSTYTSKSETDANRLARIEAHFEGRLGEIGSLLAEAGTVVRYVAPERVCVLDEPQEPAENPVREIAVALDGVPAGVVQVFQAGAGGAVAFLDQLTSAWSAELAATLREEALLEELSSSWESLEALYEVSSSLRLSNSPEVLLEGLLTRATTIGPDLQAVLWLLQADGTIRAAAAQNCAPQTILEPSGPVARCMATRNSLIVNRRAALAAMPLPEHLRTAHQVAVAPIVTSEGLKGVLELWRSEPGSEFTTHLLRLIEALAHQAGLVMDNDRLNRAFVESTRIRRDIEIGSSIQQTLLFGRAPADLPGITVAAVSKPSQTVDGDFYDFIRWRDSCIDVLVGDVMGKGIPAALLGAAAKSAFLRAMAHMSSDKEGGGIGAILRSVHEDIVPDLLRLESFVSLCYARFDLNARTVEFVDCGHPRSIHYHRATGEWTFLEGASLPVGFSATATYEPFTEAFAPGDLFLLYSDGLPEARDAAGAFFGSDRLAAVLAENASLPAQEILKAIEQSVFRFAGSDHLSDDFTCVIVQIGSELPIELVRSEWAATLANASAAREWVVSHVRRVFPDIDDELRYWSVELATAETFTNIVEHSYARDSSRMIRIELQFYRDRLAMRFLHWGAAFDPNLIPSPSFDGTRDRGFGLFLIANTMDSVQYHHDGAFGQLITMEKQFPSTSE